MTRVQLRVACVRAGGVAALANLIGKPRLYLQRRLTPSGSKSGVPQPINPMDELAILKALNLKSTNQLIKEGDKT